MSAPDPARSAYRLQVLEGGRVVYSEQFDGTLEMGRQETEEPAPFALLPRDGGARLIIASHQETAIPRRQLQITPRPDGRLELTNLSSRVAIHIAGEDSLPPCGTRAVTVAATLCFGPKRVALVNERSPAGLNSLPDATLAPGTLRRGASAWPGLKALRSPGAVKRPSATTPDAATPGLSFGAASATQQPGPAMPSGAPAWQHAPDSTGLVRALQVTMDLFQRASTAEEFFASAVDGAIELVGLHSASVVLCRDGAWSDAFCRSGDAPGRSQPASRNVLAGVLQHRRTFWDDSLAVGSTTESLVGVQAVVAAPILNRGGEVIGALYGDRKQSSSRGDFRSITGLDAMLLELLACGVASGLARLEQEDSARRMRLQFEQFFSKELACALEACPTLLDGREVDATILFCDVRGFSRISGKFGAAAATFPWINDVLENLSECVTRHGGVLVDYVGDELMAMWGAPVPQPDHAERACRAACDMLDRLPGLNERWQPQTGEPVAIGIGVNSGRVRAGNTGSTQKFKYGPLGNAVNIASRVQGATKFLKTPVLIAGDTARQLGGAFSLRRLGDVRMVHIAEPVRLYELLPPADTAAEQIRAMYEHALEQFEARHFRRSAAALAPLLNAFADDGPSLVLMSRVVSALVHGPEPEHPVWQLPGK